MNVSSVLSHRRVIGTDRSGLPIYQLTGAVGGYATEGDVLVNKTADGVDLNQIWEEVNAVVALYNAERSAYATLLSFPTTAVAEPITQAVGSDSFEEASEFGVPSSVNQPADSLLVGYDFKDFDKATRLTWRFLRDASAQQVNAQLQRIIEADNKLITGTILDRLLNPAERVSKEGQRVFALYTGTDGITPPPHLGKTFPATTKHYFTSASPLLDSSDVEDMINSIVRKGYASAGRGKLVIFCSAVEAELIQTWKKGVVNGDAGRATAKHDFIPSSASDPYFTTSQIVGAIPEGDYNTIKVLGQYGPALLLEPTEFMPAGYVAVVATGGPNSSINPVGFREHTSPEYRGLRMIPGMQQRYPLQESLFARAFGTGVRHRGAAAVCQVTTATTYTAPVIRR